MVDSWTYSCINCLRALPYVRAWADKYQEQGLVVIGVHAPEFAFEKDLGNVRSAVHGPEGGYPVAVDGNFAIWQAFTTSTGPRTISSMRKAASGLTISARASMTNLSDHPELLREAGHQTVRAGNVTPDAGRRAPPTDDVQSPETYAGYGRRREFLGIGELVPNARRTDYTRLRRSALNQWGLERRWTICPERHGQ